MTARYLSWADAFDVFTTELVRYQMFRTDGLAPAEAGALLGISTAAAQKYEDAITRLLAALKSETAPVAPETAPPNKTHPNP